MCAGNVCLPRCTLQVCPTACSQELNLHTTSLLLMQWPPFGACRILLSVSVALLPRLNRLGIGAGAEEASVSCYGGHTRSSGVVAKEHRPAGSGA